MRLGTKTNNEYLIKLNEKNQLIQESFLKKITTLTKPISMKGMLGNSTIVTQETFDPNLVSSFYGELVSGLPEWKDHGVSITNNEDIRRIFTKFEIPEGNYLLSGHLSIQFHVLLYYKPDQRVLDCQKELSEIVDMTKDKEQQISNNSDQFVLNKLKEMGYKDLDHSKLFKIFYEDDEFREKIYSEIEKDAGVDFQELSEKKTKLFNELDSLLVETYQTTNTLIDDTRLVNGEEGCLCTIDLEFIKNKNKEGLFDPKKMSVTTQENIIKRLDELEQIIIL